MKWMKGLLVLVLAGAMGMAAAGCGGDDDDQDPLIAKWRLESYNGQPVPAGISLTLTFRGNGTVEATETFNGQSETTVSTWSAANGVLTVTTEGETDTTPYAIVGSTLTLVYKGDVLMLTRQ